jgi:DNA-directed RNA polymerase subunit RPC12/RpoP
VILFTQDKTGTTCPKCGSSHDVRYVEIPPSERIYRLNGETLTEHFAETRDYVCEDCGQKWNMEIEE